MAEPTPQDPASWLQTRTAASAAAESVGVLVPVDAVGRIIGKSGTGLRQIREASRCKLHVPAAPFGQTGLRRIDVDGTLDQLGTAVQMIMTKAPPLPSSTPQFLIPAVKAGQVVGRGGENLRKAREELLVRITLERQPVENAETGNFERLLTLAGEVSNMPRALLFVLSGGSLLYLRSEPGTLSVGTASSSQAAYPSAGTGVLAPGPTPAIPAGPGVPLVSQSQLTEVRPPGPEPDELQIHMMVPDRHAGALLGKGGAQLKQVATAAGCHVSLTQRDGLAFRRAVVVGRFQACAAAQRALDVLVSEAARAAGTAVVSEVTTILLIRREAAGAVIGKQGQTLNEIRGQSGAKISLSKEETEGQRLCHIVGAIESVLLAQERLNEFIANVPVVTRSPTATSASPPAFARSPGPEDSAPSRMSGPSPILVGAPDEETKLLLPIQSIGSVIGKSGTKLKEVREATGAHIEVQQATQAPHWGQMRVVVLRGSLPARKAALEAVFRSAFPQTDAAHLRLVVTPPQAGIAIGRQGSTIRRVREQSGISVQVCRDEVEGERLVTASGHLHQVLAVASFLLDALQELPPISGQQEVPTYGVPLQAQPPHMPGPGPHQMFMFQQPAMQMTGPPQMMGGFHQVQVPPVMPGPMAVAGFPAFNQPQPGQFLPQAMPCQIPTWYKNQN